MSGGSTSSNVPNQPDPSEVARQIANAQATKEQSGRATSEQTAAHLQNQAAVSGLTTLKNHLTALQSGKQPAGSAAQNSSLDTQVSTLKQSASQMQKYYASTGDTEKAKTLEGMQTKLATIEQAMSSKPPTTSPEDLKTLASTMAQLQQMSQSLPAKEQAAFHTANAKMFDQLHAPVAQQMKDTSAAMAKNQVKVDVAEDSQDLNTFFAGKPPLSLTPNSAKDLLSKMQNLYMNQAALSPSQRTKVNNYIQQLSQLTIAKQDGGTTSLGSALSFSSTQTFISNFLQQNPGASQADIQNALSAMVQSMPTGSLKTKMELIVKNFKQLSSKFLTGSSGSYKAVSDTSFFALLAGDIQKVPDPAPAIGEIFTDQDVAQAKSHNAALSQVSKHQNLASEALQKAKDASKIAAQSAEGKSPKVTDSSSSSSPSLQDQFYSMILNHYMPGQEKYLRGKAAALSWTNAQAKIYNTLLGDTVGFGSAATTYGFSKRLSTPNTSGGAGNVYSGSPSAMKSDLSTEKTALTNNIQQGSKALADIKTQLEQLGYKDGVYNSTTTLSQLKANLGGSQSKAYQSSYIAKYSLSLSKAQALGSQLAAHQANLNGAMKNMQTLLTTLSQMKIVPAYAVLTSGNSSLSSSVNNQINEAKDPFNSKFGQFPVQVQQGQFSIEVNGAVVGAKAPTSKEAASGNAYMQEMGYYAAGPTGDAAEAAAAAHNAKIKAALTTLSNVSAANAGQIIGGSVTNGGLTASLISAQGLTGLSPQAAIAKLKGALTGATSTTNAQIQGAISTLQDGIEPGGAIPNGGKGYALGGYTQQAGLTASVINTFGLQGLTPANAQTVLKGKLETVHVIGEAKAYKDLQKTIVLLHSQISKGDYPDISPTGGAYTLGSGGAGVIHGLSSSTISKYGLTGMTPSGALDVLQAKLKGMPVPNAPSTLNFAGANALVAGIATQEGAVANGSKGSPGSGLTNINQSFTTDSQNASNESQSAQMQLQLTMTEVQQEWTIVSTALQILNQMYMSLAKSIYSL